MTNCAIFLMAKYSSERMNGKVILDMNGMPALEVLIRRLLKTGLPIYVLSTDNDSDRQHIKPIADKYGLIYHEFPVGNPVKQQYMCSLKHKIEWVINQDADDLLTCPDTILKVYNSIGSSDYITTKGLPLGMNVFAYNRRVLDGLDFNLNTGWGSILANRNRLEIVNNEDLYHAIRLTMDYPLDADTIRLILEKCKHNDVESGLISWLKANRHLMLNETLNTEYWQKYYAERGGI